MNRPAAPPQGAKPRPPQGPGSAVSDSSFRPGPKAPGPRSSPTGRGRGSTKPGPNPAGGPQRAPRKPSSGEIGSYSAQKLGLDPTLAAALDYDTEAQSEADQEIDTVSYDSSPETAYQPGTYDPEGYAPGGRGNGQQGAYSDIYTDANGQGQAPVDPRGRADDPLVSPRRKPDIFSTAAAEAEAFREMLLNQNADDTSPALRQVTASPLVWSPGSSTQSEFIANRYLIRNPREDLLGSGAKGVVYKAYDTRMGGRKVALKLFFDAFGDLNDPEVIEEEKSRSQREIEIQADLTHPSIVTIHDRFESEHGAGVVLEFVNGHTLEEEIDDKTKLPIGDAVRLAIELCKAVDFMHRQSYIHRDLKPGNVLITRDENVKLIDFGLSKRKFDKQTDGEITRRLKLSDNNDVYRTQEGDIVGTPAYMAPEQASGRLSAVDERSDVYGLGAILYHCLTGEPPINKETIEEVLDLVVAGAVPSPRVYEPKVDPALEAILMKSLSRDQFDRFQSAGAFREQLLRYQDGLPLDSEIYKEPLLKRFTRWLQSHQTLAIVIVTVFLSLGTFIGGYIVYSEQAQARKAQALFLEARLKAAQKQFFKAETLCKEVLDIAPNKAEVLLLLRDISLLQTLIDVRNNTEAELKKARNSLKEGKRLEAELSYRLVEKGLIDLRRRHHQYKHTTSTKLIRLDKFLDEEKNDRMLEEARGFIPIYVATPRALDGPLEASLRLREVDPESLATTPEALYDFDPPNGQTKLLTPITRQKVKLGFYIGEMTYNKHVYHFPVRVDRESRLVFGAFPVPPRDMLYVPGRKRFRPGHKRHDNLSSVEVSSFFIQKHEVTIQAYLLFLKDKLIQGRTQALKHKPYHWFGLEPPVPPAEWSLPITNISLESARAYATWLGQKTKLGYRLPTEAEWQLAASGGLDDRDYPYGRLYRKDWSRTSGSGADLVGSHPKDFSPFGCLDMGGNVAEWVEKPGDIGARRFLIKGGSYKDPAPVWQRNILSVTSRRDIGFRCVITADSPSDWNPDKKTEKAEKKSAEDKSAKDKSAENKSD